MKNEWINYLESIGVNDLFRERAVAVVNFYEELYPGQLQDIFVTEYVNKENKRQYENLWIFTDKACFEAKMFLKQDDFDAAPLERQVKYWNLKKTNYDFNEATPNSRLTLIFSLVAGIGCELKASDNNCNHLKKIFFNFILPNAIEPMRLIPGKNDQLSEIDI